jgi:cell division septum initiation protein DivIVA
MSLLEGNSATPDTESLIRRVIEIVEGTRTLPLSSSVKLDNKDEVLELLDEACHRLPEETRQARWMLKEREEFLAKMQREGDDILQAARLQAERMVQRTEIVREAQASARRLVEGGRDEARRLRLEAEDYCDQKLAAFEVVLDRTIKTVAAGRERLSVTPPPVVDGPDIAIAGVELDDTLGGEDAFFDQDRS